MPFRSQRNTYARKCELFFLNVRTCCCCAVRFEHWISRKEHKMRACRLVLDASLCDRERRMHAAPFAPMRREFVEIVFGVCVPVAQNEHVLLLLLGVVATYSVCIPCESVYR